MNNGNEIKYVQGQYNYVADQLSRPVRIVQRCPTTTILGLTSEEFIKCQRKEVKWREMTEHLERGSIPTKKYHKTILEQFTLKDEILYYVKEATDGNKQYTLVVPHSLGGLGIRRLADVALPANIASAEASRALVCTINRLHTGDRLARLSSAIAAFTTNQCPDLNLDQDLRHRTLDEAASKLRLDDLMSDANQTDRARLLAATPPTRRGGSCKHRATSVGTGPATPPVKLLGHYRRSRPP